VERAGAYRAGRTAADLHVVARCTRAMRIAVLGVLGAALAGVGAASTPTVSFGPAVAAPGDSLAVRVAGIGRARARLVLNPGSVGLDPVFRARRGGAARFRAWVPNVLPGNYRLSVVRSGRMLARAVRPLRIAEAPPGVRDCTSSVYGDLGPDWERRARRAGPIAFVGAASGFSAEIVARHRPLKVLVVVDNPHVVTLRVAPADRPAVALLYARRGRLGRFDSASRVTSGLPAVQFEACAASDVPHTQFNGGFVVERPLCAHFEVEVMGRHEPIPLEIPFGLAC
jgi:hypothetical protein